MNLRAAISFYKLIWFIMANRPIDQMARYKIVDSLMIAYGSFKKLSVIIHSPVGSVNRPVRTPTMGGVGAWGMATRLAITAGVRVT
jgi:hypothetical protein